MAPYLSGDTGPRYREDVPVEAAGEEQPLCRMKDFDKDGGPEKRAPGPDGSPLIRMPVYKKGPSPYGEGPSGCLADNGA